MGKGAAGENMGIHRMVGAAATCGSECVHDAIPNLKGKKRFGREGGGGARYPRCASAATMKVWVKQPCVYCQFLLPTPSTSSAVFTAALVVAPSSPSCHPIPDRLSSNRGQDTRRLASAAHAQLSEALRGRHRGRSVRRDEAAQEAQSGRRDVPPTAGAWGHTVLRLLPSARDRR